MPNDVAVPEAEEEPPSGSDVFIRHPRRGARHEARRGGLDRRQRSLLLAVVLLGAALSAPLAFIRCTGCLSLDVLYTWPVVLGFSAPAVMLLRELRMLEPPLPLAAWLPVRARDGARSRRRPARPGARRGERVSGPHRGTSDRHA